MNILCWNRFSSFPNLNLSQMSRQQNITFPLHRKYTHIILSCSLMKSLPCPVPYITLWINVYIYQVDMYIYRIRMKLIQPNAFSPSSAKPITTKVDFRCPRYGCMEIIGKYCINAVWALIDVSFVGFMCSYCIINHWDQIWLHTTGRIFSTNEWRRDQVKSAPIWWIILTLYLIPRPLYQVASGLGTFLGIHWS